jgi:hypothetical protein
MRMILPLLALAGTGCAPTEPVIAEPGPQRCDVESARSLIGTHVGAVSFAAAANVRIVCTTCPTTKDLRLDRLNIRFDEATGIIQRVDCG